MHKVCAQLHKLAQVAEKFAGLKVTLPDRQGHHVALGADTGPLSSLKVFARSRVLHSLDSYMYRQRAIALTADKRFIGWIHVCVTMASRELAGDSQGKGAKNAPILCYYEPWSHGRETPNSAVAWPRRRTVFLMMCVVTSAQMCSCTKVFCSPTPKGASSWASPVTLRFMSGAERPAQHLISIRCCAACGQSRHVRCGCVSRRLHLNKTHLPEPADQYNTNRAATSLSTPLGHIHLLLSAFYRTRGSASHPTENVNMSA